MKFERIISALYSTPLAITAEGFGTLDALLRPIVRGDRPTTDFLGQPMDIQMEIDNRIAIIPVFGPLIQHASLMDKQCGATSYQDIRQDLDDAAAKAVRAVVLNMDSPGGQIAGCIELADYIVEYQEETGIPVYAYTDTQCCSAAYFLAASCDQIVSSRSAMVGSIGCLIGFLDVSKMYEMAGLKAVLFTSGAYKAAGAPGTTLTDEQSAYFQNLVDQAFDQFSGHVISQRPAVDMENMQGQVFFGSDAEEKNIVDATFDSLEEFADFLDPNSV